MSPRGGVSDSVPGLIATEDGAPRRGEGERIMGIDRGSSASS